MRLPGHFGGRSARLIEGCRLRGFGPFEGLGITIVSFDEGSDVGSERGGGPAEMATLFLRQ
jgi:hypothetical protein